MNVTESISQHCRITVTALSKQIVYEQVVGGNNFPINGHQFKDARKKYAHLSWKHLLRRSKSTFDRLFTERPYCALVNLFGFFMLWNCCIAIYDIVTYVVKERNTSALL